MIGVTIQDVDDRNVLAVDLKDILDIAGVRALRSRWLLSEVQAGGTEAAEELQRLSDTGKFIEGDRILDLSKQVWQVIDGKFQGFDYGSANPWIIVIAVDSTAYDVVTEERNLIDTLKARFEKVHDLPMSAL